MIVHGYNLTPAQIRQALINTHSTTINRSSEVFHAWRNEKGQLPAKVSGLIHNSFGRNEYVKKAL